MVRRRCCVCKVLKDASRVAYLTEAGRRCNTCYRLGREWRECSHCAVAAACRKRGANWFCQACLRVQDLNSGIVVGTRGLEAVAGIRALIALHLVLRVHVDLWIMALTPDCCLVLVRIVFWRRFGVLAGLVPGAPARTFRISHGTRRFDASRLARHIRNLWGSGRWPRGVAPILVTGCTRAGLEDIVQRLSSSLPLGQLGRLAPCPFTLSEHGSTGGFRLQAFLRAPTTPAMQSCVLLRRVRAALWCAFTTSLLQEVCS